MYMSVVFSQYENTQSLTVCVPFFLRLPQLFHFHFLFPVLFLPPDSAWPRSPSFYAPSYPLDISIALFCFLLSPKSSVSILSCFFLDFLFQFSWLSFHRRHAVFPIFSLNNPYSRSVNIVENRNYPYFHASFLLS